MPDRDRSESQVWDEVKRIIGKGSLTLGGHWSFNLREDPKRLAFVLSRYKFAAKMASKDMRVLELGCSEGLGAPILSEFAKTYTGVDLDADATATARENFSQDKCTFITDDFLNKNYGEFDGVVSLDVCEHIVPGSENDYFDTVAGNLTDKGIAVIGTPNQTADVYASAMSKAGHVNLFDADHLRTAMKRVFHNVFSFGINDEVVHTGFAPMCHYLIVVGCNKRA